MSKVVLQGEVSVRKVQDRRFLAGTVWKKRYCVLESFSSPSPSSHINVFKLDGKGPKRGTPPSEVIALNGTSQVIREPTKDGKRVVHLITDVGQNRISKSLLFDTVEDEIKWSAEIARVIGLQGGVSPSTDEAALLEAVRKHNASLKAAGKDNREGSVDSWQSANGVSDDVHEFLTPNIPHKVGLLKAASVQDVSTTQNQQQTLFGSPSISGKQLVTPLPGRPPLSDAKSFGGPLKAPALRKASTTSAEFAGRKESSSSPPRIDTAQHNELKSAAAAADSGENKSVAATAADKQISAGSDRVSTATSAVKSPAALHAAAGAAAIDAGPSKGSKPPTDGGGSLVGAATVISADSPAPQAREVARSADYLMTDTGLGTTLEFGANTTARVPLPVWEVPSSPSIKGIGRVTAASTALPAPSSAAPVQFSTSAPAAAVVEQSAAHLGGSRGLGGPRVAVSSSLGGEDSGRRKQPPHASASAPPKDAAFSLGSSPARLGGRTYRSAGDASAIERHGGTGLGGSGSSVASTSIGGGPAESPPPLLRGAGAGGVGEAPPHGLESVSRPGGVGSEPPRHRVGLSVSDLEVDALIALNRELNAAMELQEQQALAESTALKDAIAERNRKVESLTARVEAAESRVAQSEDAQEDLQDQLQRSEQENQDLRSRIGDLELSLRQRDDEQPADGNNSGAVIGALSTERQRVAELTQAVASLESSLQASETELESLRRLWRNSKAAGGDLQETVSGLQAQLKAKEKELDRAERGLQEERLLVDELRSRLRASLLSSSDLEQRLSSEIEEEMAHESRRLMQLEQERSALVAIVDQCKAEVGVLTKESDDLKAKLAVKDMYIAALSKESQEAKIAHLEKELSAARSDLIALDAQKGKLGEELDALQQALFDEKSKSIGLGEEALMLRSQLRQREAGIESAQEEAAKKTRHLSAEVAQLVRAVAIRLALHVYIYIYIYVYICMHIYMR
jgi:hypothetical protein